MLDKAKEQLDEQIDEVKQMNQYLIQSQVYAVRERQLQEERELEAEFRDEEAKMNTMMEIERLKAVIYQKEKEQKKREVQH